MSHAGAHLPPWRGEDELMTRWRPGRGARDERVVRERRSCSTREEKVEGSKMEVEVEVEAEVSWKEREREGEGEGERRDRETERHQERHRRSNHHHVYANEGAVLRPTTGSTTRARGTREDEEVSTLGPVHEDAMETMETTGTGSGDGTERVAHGHDGLRHSDGSGSMDEDGDATMYMRMFQIKMNPDRSSDHPGHTNRDMSETTTGYTNGHHGHHRSQDGWWEGAATTIDRRRMTSGSPPRVKRGKRDGRRKERSSMSEFNSGLAPHSMMSEKRHR